MAIANLLGLIGFIALVYIAHYTQKIHKTMEEYRNGLSDIYTALCSINKKLDRLPDKRIDNLE